MKLYLLKTKKRRHNFICYWGSAKPCEQTRKAHAPTWALYFPVLVRLWKFCRYSI